LRRLEKADTAVVRIVDQAREFLLTAREGQARDPHP
jgi:hypothetical protein